MLSFFQAWPQCKSLHNSKSLLIIHFYRFRVLKVHRTEPKKLILSDDDRIYDSHEIKDILNMVDTGNRSKSQGQKTTGGLTRVKSAFGIAGFVRFHSGYYIVRIILQLYMYYTVYRVTIQLVQNLPLTLM